ncbi:MAG TPA: hypothetical protein VIV82_09880 [Verrucomicrobiae bacterium]|jgi:hypothetical protein
MSKTNFENLRVYRLAEELADAILQVVAQASKPAVSQVSKPALQLTTDH